MIAAAGYRNYIMLWRNSDLLGRTLEREALLANDAIYQWNKTIASRVQWIAGLVTVNHGWFNHATIKHWHLITRESITQTIKQPTFKH